MPAIAKVKPWAKEIITIDGTDLSHLKELYVTTENRQDKVYYKGWKDIYIDVDFLNVLDITVIADVNLIH